MQVTISQDIEQKLCEKARAEGLSAEAYVERLVREDAAWVEENGQFVEDGQVDNGEVQAAVEEGLAQVERGEGRPAAEVFAALRAKHGLSR